MWGISGDTVAVAEPPQPLPEEPQPLPLLLAVVVQVRLAFFVHPSTAGPSPPASRASPSSPARACADGGSLGSRWPSLNWNLFRIYNYYS